MEAVDRTLYSYLEELAEKVPRKRLLGQKELWLDAKSLHRLVRNGAAYFEQHGIGPGKYVLLSVQRSVPCALTILALQAVGAVAVLADPRNGLPDCSPPISVDCHLHLEEAVLVAPWGRADLFSLQDGDAVLPDGDAKAPGFIIFTSGTTGKSKAVMLSQYNLVSNLVDSQPLGDYRSDDIALGALPMNHVFGLVLLAGVCVLGYGLYFPENTGIPSLLSAIQQQRITRMNGVPSLYLAMAAQAEKYDLTSLRAGFIGGSPCTPEQFLLMEKALDMTLIPVYGMSECIGISCGDHRENASHRCRGVGRPYARNTVKILREDGREVPPGEPGEIHVTGPARMLGYYPELLPRDALFPTGDLGYLDSFGVLHLTGRKKDIIIRNGNNLSARKIEEALLSIDGIEDAAVVGMPHETEGEVPWAMVVYSPCQAAMLPDLLSPLLGKNELPIKIIPVSALPRNAAGKVDKGKIREVLKKWM